jgi:hypothetical protein
VLNGSSRGRYRILAGAVAVMLLGSACSPSVNTVPVTKAEIVGTWVDQSGQWIVLTSSGGSYMDPAMDNKNHVSFRVGMSLAPYYSGTWFFGRSQADVQISYPASWDASPSASVSLGELTWCQLGGKLVLFYGNDPDSPCDGPSFERWQREVSGS